MLKDRTRSCSAEWDAMEDSNDSGKIDICLTKFQNLMVALDAIGAAGYSNGAPTINKYMARTDVEEQGGSRGGAVVRWFHCGVGELEVRYAPRCVGLCLARPTPT